MKIFEILESKVEMCPEACCGVPVTECSCGPDCKHCDCYAKNKAMNEDEDLGNLIKTGVKGSYDFIAKSIKDFEELIKNNPNHPKVPQVKAELAKLKPMLAKAQAEMSETDSILAPLRGAAAELFGEPEVSQIPPEETALLQAMEKYKDDPAGFKDWIKKNGDIWHWLATDGSYLVNKVKQHIRETTSAGSVAAVSNPRSATTKPKKRKGVAPNALDSGENLMGGGTVKR